MLLNFDKTHRKQLRKIKSQTEEEYLNAAGKYFKSALYLMKETQQYSMQVLVPNEDKLH